MKLRINIAIYLASLLLISMVHGGGDFLSFKPTNAVDDKSMIENILL
jgi:hypothetical protein